MVMSLASQCVRVNVSKFNLKHTVKDLQLIYTLLIDVAFLSGCILVSNAAYQGVESLLPNYFMRTLRALKNLSNGSFNIVSFLYYNFMEGNISFVQMLKILAGRPLLENESCLILSKIIKNEYLNEDGKLKHFFNKYSAECCKNDVMKGALKGLLELLDDRSFGLD